MDINISPRETSAMSRPALVMNMFYTGLGIARSLGEHGVQVIGLTAQRGVYGNYTRYAKPVLCPDSRNEPQALLDFLVGFGRRLGGRSVIFPTRDHDLVFLDRYREPLAEYFLPVIPESAVLEACLNKWQTSQWALRAGVATPKCWLIEKPDELRAVLPEISYPCVLKPLEAHHWRHEHNWEVVGGRKAIAVNSEREFLAEYKVIARADTRVLVQKLVPGGDENLMIAACYMDRNGEFSAGFNTQKLVQCPEGFGTGCIVQAADRPDLFERTIRLLKAMRFTGIAEVEYKWDEVAAEYQLIEINPRPWDQHRLGRSCGTDLAYLAYCDNAGLPKPATVPRASAVKWIAEDAFLMEFLRLVWHRDPKLRRLLGKAQGERIYAIWSWRDPLPFLCYAVRMVPGIIRMAFASLRRVLGGRRDRAKARLQERPGEGG
jgi:D-aspartate ligase